MGLFLLITFHNILMIEAKTTYQSNLMKRNFIFLIATTFCLYTAEKKSDIPNKELQEKLQNLKNAVTSCFDAIDNTKKSADQTIESIARLRMILEERQRYIKTNQSDY